MTILEVNGVRFLKKPKKHLNQKKTKETFPRSKLLVLSISQLGQLGSVSAIGTYRCSIKQKLMEFCKKQTAFRRFAKRSGLFFYINLAFSPFLW